MIDRLVDKAIASLLGTIAGLKVLIGAEDIEPALTVPFCVVYSEITSMTGRKPIYAVLTRVEYNSVAGFDNMAQTEADMTAIDGLISPGGDYSSNPAVSAAGLVYLAWEAIARTTQEWGDRRKNVRELLVKAQTS